MNRIIHLILPICICIFCARCSSPRDGSDGGSGKAVLLKNVNLLTGDGSAAKGGMNILIENGQIADIGSGLSNEAATEIDLSGKTVMPAIISTHVHIATLKGTTTNAGNYTRENILNQLNKYARYGILTVQALGTDRPLLFENGLYDSLKTGQLPRARMLSAGYGFNVPQANIESTSHMNKLYRPTTAAQVAGEMDSLKALDIKVVKIWVDDFNKTVPKMDPAMYHAIIDEAHKRNMRVAAHVYYLADARRLVEDGVDMLAHSIRDSVIDDGLIGSMKAKNVVYIPTLVLEKYANAYGGEPEWLNDEFFRSSLEPGVYEMITSEKYRNDTKNNAAFARNENAFRVSLINVKKIFDAGVKVALGTDSGANPLRTQGFSEHHELQLLTEAGLTPLEAITVATKNAAETLQLNDRGVIKKGAAADLLILNGDPVTDIKNTRNIYAVYKNGLKIN